MKTISRNRKRQGYRKNKGSMTDKGNKRNKTEDKANTGLKSGFQKGKNFQGLLVGDRLYIEESQYTPRTPHGTLATYTGEG